MADKLIVSVYGQLKQKYGAQGAKDIDKRLKSLRAADKGRGLDTEILYLDFPASAGNSSLPKFPTKVDFSPDTTKATAKKLTAQVNAYCTAAKKVIDAHYKKSRFDYLMIIGGNSVLPYFRVDNPVSIDDGETDTTVPTDNPYGVPTKLFGANVKEFLLPDVPVGRLPDGETGKPDLLLALIDFAIKEAKREEKGGSSLLAIDGWGYSAHEWTKLSQSVAHTCGIDLASSYAASPPTGVNPFPATKFEKRSLHYFNLHGSLGTGIWSGQKGEDYYPDAFGPAIVAKITPKEGSAIIVEACYGADIIGRNIGQSSALAYLQRGASGFVGSTTIAYGVPEPPASAADEIATDFMQSLRGGQSMGQSLLIAKQNLAKGRGGPVVRKTLFQFQLLGDPSHHPMQTSISKFLKGVDKRRSSFAAVNVALRPELVPITSSVSKGSSNAGKKTATTAKTAKAVGKSSVKGIMASAVQPILSTAPMGKKKLRLAGELKESYGDMTAFAAVTTTKSRVKTKAKAKAPPRADVVYAVHQLFVEDKPKSAKGGAKLPPKFVVRSVYYSAGKILEKTLLSSK